MSLITENTLVIDSNHDEKLKNLLFKESKSICLRNLKQVYNKNNLIIYTFNSNGFPLKLTDYIDKKIEDFESENKEPTTVEELTSQIDKKIQKLEEGK